MNHPAALSDVIQSIVEGLTFPMAIISVDEHTDGTTDIVVCDLYHTEPGRYLTIGGNEYFIQAIDDTTNTITVTTGQPITVSTFNLYGVYYFHGTHLDTEKQVEQIPNAPDKTPMVFLLIPYRERFFSSDLDTTEREVSATLFFLTQANFAAWSTGDAMSNAIKPMQRLQDVFIKALNDKPARFFTEELEYDNTNRPKFGVFVSSKGVQRSWQSTDLSGLQMDFSRLRMLKQDVACDSCGNELQPVTGVTIYDTNSGENITTVQCGGRYGVVVLTNIVDDPDLNTSTIIDPL